MVDPLQQLLEQVQARGQGVGWALASEFAAGPLEAGQRVVDRQGGDLEAMRQRLVGHVAQHQEGVLGAMQRGLAVG